MAITREMIRELTFDELKQIKQLEELTHRATLLGNREVEPTSKEATDLAEQVWAFIQKRYNDSTFVLESPSLIADEWLGNVYRPRSMRDVRGLPKSLRQQGIVAMLDLYSDENDVEFEPIVRDVSSSDVVAQVLLRDGTIETAEDVIDKVAHMQREAAKGQTGNCMICHLPVEVDWVPLYNPNGSFERFHPECLPSSTDEKENN